MLIFSHLALPSLFFPSLYQHQHQHRHRRQHQHQHQQHQHRHLHQPPHLLCVLWMWFFVFPLCPLLVPDINFKIESPAHLDLVIPLCTFFKFSNNSVTSSVCGSRSPSSSPNSSSIEHLTSKVKKENKKIACLFSKLLEDYIPRRTVSFEPAFSFNNFLINCSSFSFFTGIVLIFLVECAQYCANV